MGLYGLLYLIGLLAVIRVAVSTRPRYKRARR